MNKLLKGGLAVAGGAVVTEVLRRLVSFQPQPKSEPWERVPFTEVTHREPRARGGVGGAVVTEVLRRLVSFQPQPKYEPWERVPFTEFTNRVLIVGGGFAGFTVAKTLGDLTEDRDDVGVMVINKENFFTYWPMVAGIISSDVETKNVAQPLRRASSR